MVGWYVALVVVAVIVVVALIAVALVGLMCLRRIRAIILVSRSLMIAACDCAPFAYSTVDSAICVAAQHSNRARGSSTLDRAGNLLL